MPPFTDDNVDEDKTDDTHIKDDSKINAPFSREELEDDKARREFEAFMKACNIAKPEDPVEERLDKLDDMNDDEPDTEEPAPEPVNKPDNPAEELISGFTADEINDMIEMYASHSANSIVAKYGGAHQEVSTVRNFHRFKKWLNDSKYPYQFAAKRRRRK